MWYIMNYSQIQGLVGGTFSDFDMMFYQGPDEDSESHLWCPLIDEAKGYASHMEARDEAYRIWGKTHADGTFGYVEIIAPDLRGETAMREYKKRGDLGRRLSRGDVSPSALIKYADHFLDHGMTWREAKMIKTVVAKKTIVEKPDKGRTYDCLKCDEGVVWDDDQQRWVHAYSKKRVCAYTGAVPSEFSVGAGA